MNSAASSHSPLFWLLSLNSGSSAGPSGTTPQHCGIHTSLSLCTFHLQPALVHNGEEKSVDLFVGMGSALPVALNTWLHRSWCFEMDCSVVDVEFEVGMSCVLTGLVDG